MRSTTVLAALFAFACTSVFAAPTPLARRDVQPIYARDEAASLVLRDVMEALDARDLTLASGPQKRGLRGPMRGGPAAGRHSFVSSPTTSSTFPRHPTPIMRSTTVVAALFAFACTSVLAAPTPLARRDVQPIYSRDEAASLVLRDVMEALEARDLTL
ncbi:hypothetical protein EIP91_011758 [Steccherinum ochraceum]|uniref:Uncharacterized protein n=1 Tax=Steccherinum ochraceum TaxID=92696 RepID=A0A4V2MWY4_9APHY|nr:hypothetical protein EIP91_011758 [Steccherinum ochraceum]